MRAPRSITGSLAQAPVLRDPWKRRALFGGLIAVAAVLSLFPHKYRAAVSLTPTDPNSLGLSGTLGQLGAINSVFGNQSAIEVSLKVARGQYVRTLVEQRTDLLRKLGKTKLETDRWLDRKMDIRSLRGGIVQFEIKLTDPDLGKAIVGAYGDATREQLGTIARNQTSYKRKILDELVEKANDRLTKARAAYDTFRLSTRYSSPQMAIYSLGDRVPELERAVREKQVQLNAARQFGTDDNMTVRQITAEIDALKSQLAYVRSIAPDDTSSVGQVVRQSTELDRLKRELDFAQSLFDSYKRFLQGTAVEDLTSTATVRVLEPAYIDSERQLNYIPLGAAIMLFVLAVALEFYLLRPPFAEQVPA